MTITEDFSPRVRAVRMLHTGDLLGDIVASLPALRQLGGGKIVISEASGWPGPRESMKGARYDAIRPLLEAQDYVTGVQWHDKPPKGITHDLSRFRESLEIDWAKGFRWDGSGDNLATWQARALGISNLDVSPWLDVGKIEPTGKIVVSRSSRYHNFFFPWPHLIYRFRKDVVFAGLESEHKAMEQLCGFKIPYQPTADLLELARLIAGAKFCIMNQSAPFWIAAGLGITVIQESWETSPNSVILRDNAHYTLTGADTRTLMYRIKKGLLKIA